MNDGLGNRMKTYESVSSSKLVRRIPVIVRVDGKAFHSWTKKIKAKKPFDEDLIDAMALTTKYLCENIQGCRLGYTQSDEISLLLVDYSSIESDAYFDNKVQKICSVVSSLATGFFNRAILLKHFDTQVIPYPLAFFDARCFNVPKEEVCNAFIWRQQDCTRNSIQMLARSLFSHKECENKNSSELQDMMMLKHNVNWNDLETYKKRGTCVYKELEFRDDNTTRTKWKIDKDIPIFTQDREFISKWTMSGNVEELLKCWHRAEYGVYG